MNIEVDKSDLHTVRVRPAPPVTLLDGQVSARIESFGISANNITYAVMGESMRYWDFFPSDDPSWGRVPTWGYARIAESNSPHVPEGSRIFGYFPMSTAVTLTPGRSDAAGFSDVAEHRASLPSVYNRYSYVDHDPLYDPRHEDETILFRPLFITSFVVDDFLGYHDVFGATTVIVSSASSKTALGIAHLCGQRLGIHVIGLTSRSNLEFTSETGLYDDVLSYDDLDQLPLSNAVYIDVAGRRDVTHRVHSHYGDQLRYSMIVGDTHWDADVAPTTPLPGPKPTLLFAPDRIRARRAEWGRDGFEDAVGAAWESFAMNVRNWLDVRHLHGPDDIMATYLNVLEGRIDPRIGYICSFLA